MRAIIKKYLKNIKNKNNKLFLKKHLWNISVDTFNKELTLFIDKKYMANLLSQSNNLDDIFQWVSARCWDDYKTTIKLTELDNNSKMYISRMVNYIL